MSIKKIVAATALTVGCLGQAQATPAYFDEHKQLIAAVQSTGIEVQLNTHECSKGIGGLFQPSRKRIVVCQDHGTPGGPEVGWTEGDLDTLRHEAHHVTQGCMIGHNHDAHLGLVYLEAFELVKRELSYEQAIAIVQRYQRAGFSDEVIRMELEAFAVAAMVDPLEQVQDIKRFCF